MSGESSSKRNGRLIRCPVEGVGYDESKQELHVVLRGGVIYTYHKVPPEAAEAFKLARLPGIHYMRHIRDVYRSSGGTRGASGLTAAR